MNLKELFYKKEANAITEYRSFAGKISRCTVIDRTVTWFSCIKKSHTQIVDVDGVIIL